VSHAEVTVDYGPVRIGDKVYILPTRAQNLACFTESSECTMNETEFRNYRKFSAESSISTTESTVTFDGDNKPPKK
jgi:hypothetical protein